MSSHVAATGFTIEKWAARILGRCVVAILLVAAIAYPLDWAIWRARVSAGGGMDQVMVQMFVVSELKGGKEEYFPQGSTMLQCSKTLYPQGGNSACWWVARHREHIDRY